MEARDDGDRLCFLLLNLILKSLSKNTADITPAKDEPAMRIISADILLGLPRLSKRKAFSYYIR
jgi:hypothetical protein